MLSEVSVHRVTNTKIRYNDGLTKWVDIFLYDDDGQEFSLTIFPKKDDQLMTLLESLQADPETYDLDP
tara:strand:- start:293 stop:496 length:204 start_codon:yes stop_codon:yes gene_type:complete